MDREYVFDVWARDTLAVIRAAGGTPTPDSFWRLIETLRADLPPNFVPAGLTMDHVRGLVTANN